MADSNLPAVLANALPDEAAMKDWAELLVARSRTEGVELTGDRGLLTGLVRQVLQTGVGGHEILRVGGHETARSWPLESRAGGHQKSAGCVHCLPWGPPGRVLLPVELSVLNR